MRFSATYLAEDSSYVEPHSSGCDRQNVDCHITHTAAAAAVGHRLEIGWNREILTHQHAKKKQKNVHVNIINILSITSS